MKYNVQIIELGQALIMSDFVKFVTNLEVMIPALSRESKISFKEGCVLIHRLKDSANIVHLIEDYTIRRRFIISISAVSSALLDSSIFSSRVHEMWEFVCECILTNWEKVNLGALLVDFDSSRFIFRACAVCVSSVASREVGYRLIADLTRNSSQYLIQSVYFSVIWQDICKILMPGMRVLLCDLLQTRTIIPVTENIQSSIERILEMKNISLPIVLNSDTSDLHRLMAAVVDPTPNKFDLYDNCNDWLIKGLILSVHTNGRTGLHTKGRIGVQILQDSPRFFRSAVRYHERLNEQIANYVTLIVPIICESDGKILCEYPHEFFRQIVVSMYTKSKPTYVPLHISAIVAKILLQQHSYQHVDVLGEIFDSKFVYPSSVWNESNCVYSLYTGEFAPVDLLKNYVAQAGDSEFASLFLDLYSLPTFQKFIEIICLKLNCFFDKIAKNPHRFEILQKIVYVSNSNDLLTICTPVELLGLMVKTGKWSECLQPHLLPSILKSCTFEEFITKYKEINNQLSFNQKLDVWKLCTHAKL